VIDAFKKRRIQISETRILEEGRMLGGGSELANIVRQANTNAAGRASTRSSKFRGNSLAGELHQLDFFVSETKRITGYRK
jgi:hypothetical protein